MLTQKPDFTARLRHAWQAFLLGGPVGLGHALRLALNARRMRWACICIDAEKETHRQELRKLRRRINHLAGQQQVLHAAAAQFHAYSAKRDTEVQP